MEDIFEAIEIISDLTNQKIRDAERRYDTYNDAFVWLGIREDLRSKVNARWALAKPYSETNFLSEILIRDNFYARHWELNLRGLIATKLIRKPNDGEPDLIAENFVIEAVVPETTDVPVVQYNGQEFSYPTDQINRRVTTALISKHNQLQRRKTATNALIDYSRIPFIIAIGLPQRDFMSAVSMSGIDIVESVLMGAGPLQISFDSEFRPLGTSVSTMHSIQSRNGTEFDVAYFQRDGWKDVSAVMWSSALIPELSDINVLLNPNANIPLSPSDIGIDGINYITYTRTETGYTRDQPL